MALFFFFCFAWKALLKAHQQCIGLDSIFNLSATILFSCPRPWRRQDTCTMPVLASQVVAALWEDTACRAAALTQNRRSFFFQEWCTHCHALRAFTSKNYNSPQLCFVLFHPPCRLPTAQPCLGATSCCLLPAPWMELWAAELSKVLFGGCTHSDVLSAAPSILHLSWCLSQMVTIRLQMVSLL